MKKRYRVLCRSPRPPILKEFAFRDWRPWKRYKTEKGATEAVSKLNRNHACIGWEFKLEAPK